MSAPADRPTCPRCGYDVSGTMSQWTESCPLDGRCSECGYGFQWKHLLGPNLGVPKWFFETARRRLIRAAISTSVRTVVPWHFWKKVPLHAPVVSWRIALVCIASALVGYVWSVVCMTGPEIVFRTKLHINAGASASYPLVWKMFLEHSLPVAMKWHFYGGGGWRRTLVRPVMAAYAISVAIMPICFLTVRATLRVRRVRIRHLFRAAGYSGAILSIFACAWFAVLLIHTELVVPRSWAPTRPAFYVTANVEQLWFLWPAIMVGWWWCVCRFYLRIRHAFWVAMLMQAMALLCGAAVAYHALITESLWAEYWAR